MKKLLCALLFTVISIGFVQAQQDINVQGNGVNIVDGDITPSATDHTDFEQVTVGSNLVRTFTIQNTGDAPLNLTSIGTGLGTNTQFTVDISGVTTPLPATTGSTTFTVTFTPTVTGVATGSIVISSDDPDAESTYTFNIQAEGVAVAEPDINVQGNSIDILDGDTTPDLADHTDFGQVSIGSNLVRTYTIQNTGSQPLNLTSIAPALGTNAQFSISSVGTTTPVPGNGGTTTFTVTFTPTTAGLVTGGVVILSDDPDAESTYTFSIQAEGLAGSDINVQGNSVDIADGDITPDLADHTDFGQITIGSNLIRTFTIQNTGNADLNLSSVSLGLGSNSQFTADISSVTTPVSGSGGSTTFTVTFTPTVTGLVTGNIVIISDDPDAESTYTFNIQAEGIAVTEPDINVQGNSVDIADGDITPDLADHTDFGQITIGSNLIRTFTIQNTGNADLNLSSVSLGLGSNSQFTADISSVTTPVPGSGGSTTFTVTFTPTVTGIVTGNIVIISDDPDAESTYTFNIQAEGIANNEPEIDVFGNGVEIADGDTTPSLGDDTDFGQVNVTSGSNANTFTIQNNGTVDLNISGVTITGANASDFTITSNPSSVVSASGSTTFIVSFDPSAVGIRTATISVANDDSDENPYNFDIQGEGIDVNAGSPLLITQYYEGTGSNQWIEVKNVSTSTVTAGSFFLALYTNNGTTIGQIDANPPNQSISIPAMNAGDVLLFSNPGAALPLAGNLGQAGIGTNVCTFDGNDVILISTTNDAGCYAARIDIVGVVGSSSPPSWGADTSFIKGCGTNESPTTTFDYTSGTNTVNDYIELTLAEVNNANSNTNIALGTQSVGSTIYTSSWNNGIPDKTKDVIISGTYNAATGSFEACNLTVSGNLNMNGSTTNFVKVNENLAISGTFTIGDTEALVQVSETASNSGSITKLENSTPLNNSSDFTYWSSPVQGAGISSVFSGVDPNRIFFWRTPVNDDPGAWVIASGAMEVGRGYISEAPSGSTQHNVSFTGTPNNGLISEFLGLDSNFPGGFGSNIIGNPYPSAIDLDLFIQEDDNSNFDGSIWLWTHNTGIADNPGQEEDFTVADYATYNLSGGTAACGSCPVPTNNLGSGQGFLVNALSTGPVFFNNAMRLDGQNDQFFRGINKKSSNVDKDRMWLDVTSKEGGAFNQILIGFFEKATDGFDRGYDGIKIDGGNYISLYSKLDDDIYTIQGLGSYSSDKTVAIGFDAWIKETFSISISKMEGVLNSEEIYLVDNELNVVHDLKNSGYEFEITEVGSFSDRFTLQFNKSVLGVGDEDLNNNFIVINEDNTLRIRSNNQIKEIKVYDMLGRLLLENKPNESDFYLNTQSISKGTVLILNAVLENGAEVSKKAIKY